VLTLKCDKDKANVEGFEFRPGYDLRETYDVWQLHSPEMKALLKQEAIRDRGISTKHRSTRMASFVFRDASTPRWNSRLVFSVARWGVKPVINYLNLPTTLAPTSIGLTTN
jgi:hypothetical protein